MFFFEEQSFAFKRLIKLHIWAAKPQEPIKLTVDSSKFSRIWIHETYETQKCSISYFRKDQQALLETIFHITSLSAKLAVNSDKKIHNIFSCDANAQPMVLSSVVYKKWAYQKTSFRHSRSKSPPPQSHIKFGNHFSWKIILLEGWHSKGEEENSFKKNKQLILQWLCDLYQESTARSAAVIHKKIPSSRQNFIPRSYTYANLFPLGRANNQFSWTPIC
jgi:hypothetical protein